MKIEFLKHAGIDFDAAMELLGDADLYESLLHSFLDGDALERAIKSYENKNYEDLMRDVHEIKGVSGNMSMKTLYDATCGVVDLLRRGNFSENEMAVAFGIYRTAFQNTRDAIVKAIE